MIQKFRKKPVVIEAIKLTYDKGRLKEVIKFIGKSFAGAIEDPRRTLVHINTLEGRMTAKRGDYIIKGVNGEFYPCKPGIFRKTYEKVK